MAKQDTSTTGEAGQAESAAVTTAHRRIPGNLPYMTASGTLKKALDRLVDAQQPPRYNADFLENVLSLTGGAARATISILKRMGFVGGDGTPTELYSKFRTVSGRGPAALQGLQNAFSEIFRRSTYAHSVPDAKLKDIIVEITGLPANDPVAVAIRSTFNALKSYIPPNMETPQADEPQPKIEIGANQDRPVLNDGDAPARDIRLAYNINIVLPETSDLTVLNAIFKSIRENLMQ